MAKYGIPYMGSKGGIADEVIKLFPKADNFYDLFGGGFSITHAMLLRRSNSFKQFHFNEIKADIVDLIKRAIAGEFNYKVFKPPFVDRETFLKNLSDPYIRCIWSFGNNQKGYLFSTEIEPYKKSMHNAVVFNDFDELAAKVFGHKGFKDGYSIEARRLFLGNRVERYRLDGIPDFLFPFLNENQLQQLGRLRQLQQLERLKRLQQLEQLQQLERLEHLRFYSVSYDLVPIKPNSVVYCDPPYRGTADYGGEFDHDKFLDWCHKQTEPVFISEYDISDKRFRPVRGIEKRSLLAGPISGKTKDKNIEKIYINQAGAKRFL